MTRNPRAGFSALEMGLCFLGIAAMSCGIAVLAAGARERARAVSCGSNLQQLALAMQMYAMDHGGRGPVGSAVETMYPYTNNYDIFRCPANRDAPEVSAGDDGLTTYSVGYSFRAGFWTDESPRTIIVQDIVRDVHPGGTWQGARLDGAVRVFPAEEWQPLE